MVLSPMSIMVDATRQELSHFIERQAFDREPEASGDGRAAPQPGAPRPSAVSVEGPG